MFLLGIAPILVAIVSLVFRRGPVVAAGGGLLVAAVLSAIGPYRIEPGSATGVLPYSGLTLEVLTILLFGITLARLLQDAGAMDRIAACLNQAASSRMAGTALVVYGVVPFAESVTGFGIGITIGVPILISLGHPAPRAALLGLLGMVAVPWGALGPGTAVAASLATLELDALGVATGVVNVVPILVSAIAVLWLCRSDRHVAGIVTVLASAGLLWVSILVANVLFGTPPAGVVGSIIVILGLLTGFRLHGRRIPIDTAIARSLLPYAILTAGILTTRLLTGGSQQIAARIATSPSTWLAVACVAATFVLPLSTPLQRTLPAAGRSWIPVGLSTAGFMIMGWLMAVNGMSQMIGSAASFAETAPGPFLTSLGSILTGSNTGANAMFASTVLILAENSRADPLLMVAIANAAGCFAALAHPPRVAMAVALAYTGISKVRSSAPFVNTSGTVRRTLTTTLGIAGASAALLALLSLVLQ